MNARQQLTAALPRLAPGTARVAPAWNAAGVVCTGLTGAAVVHLLAYHLPLGSRWAATALTLLASCPLSGALGAVGAVAIAAVLLALRELRRLKRLDAALARLAATRTTTLAMEEAQPRSLGRLAALAALLLGLQLALTVLVDAVCPMQAGMVMHGAHMSMAVPAAMPLAPLHLIVAVLLALLLWRVERRLTRLRARIARRLYLLGRASASTARPPVRRVAPLPRGWRGHALFARPPPLAA